MERTWHHRGMARASNHDAPAALNIDEAHPFLRERIAAVSSSFSWYRPNDFGRTVDIAWCWLALGRVAQARALADELASTIAGTRTVEALGLRERRRAVGDAAIARARRTRLRTLFLRSVLFPAVDVSYVVPVVTVLLVGGGPEAERLQALTRRLGLEGAVRFIGRVPHAQVRAYYDLVDLLVYPRRRMRLTDLVTPLKPLEAMAERRLVVASDVGGHQELIHDNETGYLFAADDVTMDLIKRRELLRRLDVVGLRLIEAVDALSDGLLKRHF